MPLATGASRGASRSRLVGVIADTHGLLRPEVIAAFAGCSLILHAGDIGEGVLQGLREIAPVIAVRGNTDLGKWGRTLQERELVEVEGTAIAVIHDLMKLDIDPRAAGVSLVISGHSHVPLVSEHSGVVFLNPGSAGPRRFDFPVTVARLVVGGGSMTPEIVDLGV